MQKRGAYLRVLRGGKNGDSKLRNQFETKFIDANGRCLTVLNGGIQTIRIRYSKAEN